jgi:hypothetical protein
MRTWAMVVAGYRLSGGPGIVGRIVGRQAHPFFGSKIIVSLVEPQRDKYRPTGQRGKGVLNVIDEPLRPNRKCPLSLSDTVIRTQLLMDKRH